MRFGLSLGGGGAKGFAHLGVLKVLETVGFKPDVISGTSAGALVGALIAKGLSADEIFALRKDFDFFKVMRWDYPLDGLSSMDGFRNALKPYFDEMSFKELRLKLLVVATNLRTGKETVFSKGNVIDAVCASCSVPGVFNPTLIAGEYYVDGGLVSPAPVDCLKREGVDKVVSVSLEHLSPSINRFTILKILAREHNITNKHLMDVQESNADVSIRVPSYDFDTVSTNKAIELFSLGERTARKFLPEIKKLLKD